MSEKVLLDENALNYLLTLLTAFIGLMFITVLQQRD